jgi:hypothetical protein
MRINTGFEFFYNSCFLLLILADKKRCLEVEAKNKNHRRYVTYALNDATKKKVKFNLLLTQN